MTAKPVVPRLRANQDVEAAIDRYLSEASATVALDFVAALEEAYGHLSRQPATGSPRYAHELNLAGLRFWPLSRFPYLVFYFDLADCVDVWRVLHAQSDIPAWMQSA